MQHFIDQAIHNERFHECVHSNFSDSFFDWEITILFYTAIHYLKALAANRNIDIGNTHTDIEYNCNPDRRGLKMPITRRAWNEYKSLYRYSHTSRYEGITDIETFDKLKEIDYGYCKIHLEAFKKYIKGQGLPIR
jgi:hypothetical protein